MNSSHPVNSKKNLRTAIAAGAVAFGMVGLAYASVPLYSLFCKVTGFGGTPQISSAAPKTTENAQISIRFDANAAGELGWQFEPVQRQMTVKIGEVVLAEYQAINQSGTTATGTAVFNVTPAAAGAYFNKIECFCFTEQTLNPGEKITLPVQYFVDPAILDNPDAAGIKEITLSYTFYPARQKTVAAKTN
jgi:cytochrome c oxidase assembly protein subunit 11